MAVAGFIKPYRSAPKGGPTKVWFIGDSIARGAEPVAAGASYVYNGGVRQWVYAMMTAASAQPSFVGAQLNSSESPAVTNCGVGHDGLNNSSAAQWLASVFAARYALNGFDASSNPDIVVMILGANDGDDSATGTTIAQVADLVAASCPRATILVCTVMPTPQLTRTATNTQLRTEIASRKARGYHMELIELETLATMRANKANIPDDQHPNAALYRRMGDAINLYVAPLLT